MRFLTGVCLGWGAVLPPAQAGGALGYCWGWAGGRAAFSFPHLPWNHLQKKTGKKIINVYKAHFPQYR